MDVTTLAIDLLILGGVLAPIIPIVKEYKEIIAALRAAGIIAKLVKAYYSRHPHSGNQATALHHKLLSLKNQPEGFCDFGSVQKPV